MRKQGLYLGTLFVLAAAGGCSAAEPVSANKMAVLGAEERSIAEQAKAVLADRLEIPVSTITVDTVRAVTWQDTSIGCPEPGVAYGQVLTPGHQVTLQAGDSTHSVHIANGKAFVCQRSKARRDAPAAADVEWLEIAGKARADLASKVGTSPDKIRVMNAGRRVWSSTALGCDDPRGTAMAVPVDGWVITLRYGDRDFTYHTDSARVLPCPPISVD